ncbi:MAG: hypothetical protein EB166_09775, partial [Thaumarchaeota archaeon]|nr:hypothetical protein [Nitrososphaerota archaeon]
NKSQEPQLLVYEMPLKHGETFFKVLVQNAKNAAGASIDVNGCSGSKIISPLPQTTSKQSQPSTSVVQVQSTAPQIPAPTTPEVPQETLQETPQIIPEPTPVQPPVQEIPIVPEQPTTPKPSPTPEPPLIVPPTPEAEKPVESTPQFEMPVISLDSLNPIILLIPVAMAIVIGAIIIKKKKHTPRKPERFEPKMKQPEIERTPEVAITEQPESPIEQKIKPAPKPEYKKLDSFKIVTEAKQDKIPMTAKPTDELEQVETVKSQLRDYRRMLDSTLIKLETTNVEVEKNKAELEKIRKERESLLTNIQPTIEPTQTHVQDEEIQQVKDEITAMKQDILSMTQEMSYITKEYIEIKKQVSLGKEELQGINSQV